MKNIILFDLDGTISDAKVGIIKSFQHALRYFGINIENLNDLYKFIGPPIRPAFKEFYGFDDFDAEKAVEKYREYYLEKGIFETVMYDGIDVMVKKLKDLGKTLIVATSKPTGQAQRILEHFALNMYFSFVSGAELNGDRSDKSEVIQYAFEKNNINNKSYCVMVGDRKHDIIGAKTVGINSIGVLYGYGSQDELTEAGADYLVKNVNELSDLLCTQ